MGGGVGPQGLTSTTRFAARMKAYGQGRVGWLVSQQLGTEAGFRILALGYGLLCAAQPWRDSRPQRV